MKKIVTFCIVVLAAVSFASAQNLQNSKLSDNWFFGIDGGAFAKTTHRGLYKHARSMVGLKIGRYITPVFGLRLDGQFYINANWVLGGKTATTAFDYDAVSMDALFNLNNLFFGYKGNPRFMELVAVTGFGWFHGNGQPIFRFNKNLTKFGVQLNFNLGKARAWQINIEPDLCYYAAGGDGHNYLNINHSISQISGGFTYKFGCSNGTHNFALAKPYDQGEIDALNAQVNKLRGTVENRDNTINADQQKIDALQRQLDACEATPKTVVKKDTVGTTLAPVVIFDQGKAVINPAQAPSVKMIATYLKNHPDAKVTIKGYASPEGNADLNKKLSENRANAVKEMLVKKYKVSANRLKTVGLGATTEVFDESDWNRVCTFVEK
jgi:OOP family OmpA-OmpF porin